MHATTGGEAAPANAAAERPAAESGEREDPASLPGRESPQDEAPWPDADGWVARDPPPVVEAAAPTGRDASAAALAEAAGVQLDLLREVFPGRVLRFVPAASAAADEASEDEAAADEAPADEAPADTPPDERRLLTAPSDDRDAVPGSDDRDEHPAHGGQR